MNNLEKQIAELEALAKEQNRKIRRASLRNGVIYGLLVVIVAAYTSILYRDITQLATPENISTLVIEQIKERMPEAVAAIRAEMVPAAGILADRSVGTVEALIPQAGDFLRETLGEEVGIMLDSMEKEQMPVIAGFLDKAMTEALKNKQAVKDGSLGKTLSKAVCRDAGKQIDDIVNANFYNGVNSLRDQLSSLRDTPFDKLDRRSSSEKRFLLYWLYLCDHADQNSGAVGTIMNTLGSACKGLNTEILPE